MKLLYFNSSLHYTFFLLKWLLLTVNHGTGKRGSSCQKTEYTTTEKAVQCTERYSGEEKTESPQELIPLNIGRR
jgi:hypothetical protein